MSQRTILSSGEKQSPTWNKVLTHLYARMNALRMQNDKPLDADATARVRGAIDEIKSLIKLNEDEPIIDGTAARN